jgi:hypothetical protein
MKIKTHRGIYAELSQKYNIPLPVIEVICNSPFKFANNAIRENDTRAIMLAYLFKIKRKKSHEDITTKDSCATSRT